MSNDPNYLHDLGERVYEVNVANGWFEDDRRFAEDIALLHSEVSEALEAYREWGFTDKLKYKEAGGVVVDVGSEEHEEICNKLPGIIGKPEGVGSELADVLIRLVDTARRANIDLHAQTERKLAFNATRGWKHGGKKL